MDKNSGKSVTHQYNQTPHTITGFPPTYLMYGNLPFEISLKDNEIYPPIEEARQLAKERTEQYYKINKIRHDKKFQKADFNVGDLVIQRNSLAASVKLTYSASMVDRLMDFCLKVRHEIGVSSIKVMNPPIDTRSSLFVAKSESE
ncbi:retrotransposable element Tf2 protein type 3 [Trichonephila clavipes]|nr:retrotransposable element Tf2 protein type 3 [Trichonephila clavipes]